MLHNELEEIEAICDPRGKRKKWLSFVNGCCLSHYLGEGVKDAMAYRIREIHRRGLRRFKTSIN